jgi:hypothetical protein
MSVTRSPRRSWSLRLLALLAVVALAASGCSNSGDDEEGSGSGSGSGSGTEDGEGGDLPADLGEGPHGEFQSIEGVPGVTDDEIKFAVLSTGEANPLGYCLLECQAQAVESYFAWRNSQGGVHGRDLVLEQVDDEMANNQVKALEIIESGEYFGVIGAPIVASGFADLAGAGYPVYTGFPQSVEANGFESIYQPAGALCIECPSRRSLYIATVAGATAIGTLGFGVSQASKDCVAGHNAAVDKWGEDAGITVGYSNDDLAFGLPNGIGPEVTAMKEAGVDFVLTCFDQNSALTLEEEMERQGMGDVPTVLPNAYADHPFIEENADLLEGSYVGVGYRPFEADPAGTGIEDYLEWTEELGYEANDWGMLTWINADLAFRGILAAGPEFDQAKVVEATNTFTEYTADGLVTPTDWSRQHTAPTPDDPVTNGATMDCYAWVKVEGGEFVLEGDPEKPHVCWDTTLEGWEDPEPTSFAADE